MAEAFLKVILDKLRSLITDEIGLILGVDKEMQKLSNTLITLQAELKDTEIKQIVNSSFRDWVLDKLRSLITDEIGLILGVDKEMQKLSNTLITLQAELKDTEIKQIVNSSFRDWVHKLRAVAHKINNILDECNTHVSKLNKLSRYSPRNMFYSHMIRGRMKRVTEKLEGVATESAKFQMPADKPREVVVPASRETISLLTRYDQIYDREEDKEKIVQILVNDVKENKGISVLPIIGVGGLGKTALAKLVYNDPRVGEHFDLRIWVYVSNNFELKTLVKAMIEDATGSAVALGQLDVLQRELRKLLSQKRYLIVLDDVWNEDQEKWFKLKNILSCGSTGASIIVTTRQNMVAHIMGTLPAHSLKRLSDENCWMLLRSRAFGPNEEVSPHLEIIGKEIVKKCAGVPLIAEALGGILRFKRTREEWLYVKEDELHNLQLSSDRDLYIYYILGLTIMFCYSCIESSLALISFRVSFMILSRIRV